MIYKTLSLSIMFICAYASTGNMSKHLVKNRDYLMLLLNTSKNQAVALIDSATTEQIALLSEIAYNLLRLPLGKKAARLVKSKQQVFDQLAKKGLGLEQKQRLLRKNYKLILTVLWELKQQLQQLQ